MASEDIFKLSEENGEDSVDIIGYSQELAKSIENALKNKVSSKELETEIDKNTAQDKDIQSLYNISPKQKLQGTSFHITNSAEAPMKISPRGNMEQDTREGYNLIDLTGYATTTTDGVTVSQNEDGSFNASGTGTKNYINFRANEDITNLLEDGETYTLWTNQHNSLFYIQIRAVKTDNTEIYYPADVSNRTIKIDKTNVKQYVLKIQSGASSNGATYDLSNVQFMLYKGTEEKEYEQYGAMPSLDFPSPVKHVGGKFKSYNELTEKFIVGASYVGNQTNRLKIDQDLLLKKDTKYNFVTNLDTSLFNYAIALSNISFPVPSGTTNIYYDSGWLTDTKKQFYTSAKIDTYFNLVIKKVDNTNILPEEISNYYFMLVEGVEEKPYLPYGDIGSVYDIAEINKNLFDKNKKDMLSSFYKTDGSIGTSSSSWYITNIKVKPNTNYYLSGNNFSNTTACTVLLDKNKKHIKTIGGYSDTHLIATTNDTAYIGLSIPIHSTVTDVNTLMLEVGNTTTEYIAHQQENYLLDLTNLPLYSKNDYIYKKDDKWYVYNEWGKYIFNGTEINNIAFENTDTIQFQANQLTIKEAGLYNIVSNMLPTYAGDVNKESILGATGKTFIQFLINKDRNITTAEGLNSLLKELYDNGTPLYIVYKLITPTETEITDKKVIAQLEELYNTYAYDEVTNISVDNPVLSAELVLDVLYYQKTALGLETKVSYEEYAKLLKRVEELENVILTLGGTI